MYLQCILAVPKLYLHCTLAVIKLNLGCTLAVTCLYLCCTLTVPFLYLNCTLSLPRLYPTPGTAGFDFPGLLAQAAAHLGGAGAVPAELAPLPHGLSGQAGGVPDRQDHPPLGALLQEAGLQDLPGAHEGERTAGRPGAAVGAGRRCHGLIRGQAEGTGRVSATGALSGGVGRGDPLLHDDESGPGVRGGAGLPQ